MIKEIIATGKDVTEAKENARAALGAGPLDDVNFEVLHAGSKGIFGIIGVKPAQFKAYIEIADKKVRRPRPEKKREKKKPEVQKAPHKENKKPQGDGKKAQPRVEKPRAAVIPEPELKFERLEVGEGEDMSYEFVKTLIANIGLSAEAELFSCDDGTRRISIQGEEASVLIGHHGDTLDALQYLANLAGARKNIHGEKNKSRVTVDIEGYRAKREETLRALARRMAAKALRNRRSVMLEPMSAYERRIIHSEIQSIEGVSTNSIGSDNNRKIVIFLTDKKPKEIFEEDERKNAPTEESAKALTEEVVETVEAPVEIAEAVQTVETVVAEDEENKIDE